jgi:DNA-binding NarL/FixJ family response regulator
MRDTYSIVLVEPNTLLREGLSRIVRAARFRIVSSTAAYDDALLDAFDRGENLLLIVGLGAEAHAGTEQIRRFKAKFPLGRAAVVADSCHLNDVLSALKAGADGYFVQSTACDAFTKALELVMLGETVIPPEIVRHILNLVDGASVSEREERPIVTTPLAGASTPNLSAQEKRILNHLIEGGSNKAIARKLEIAEATVKVHIKAILRKIQMRNRTQAAIWAMHNFPEAVVNGARQTSLERSESHRGNGMA